MTRSLRFLPLALISAIITLVVAPQASAADPVPAWCRDGDAWLGYSENTPGSSDRDAFTQCLQSAAQRGTITSFDAQIVNDGVLFDLGSASLLWVSEDSFALDLAITAYEQHVTIGDNCDRLFKVHAGFSQMIAPGFPCTGGERVREDVRIVHDPDFTIYIIDTQFVIDGPDGWYHIVRDQTGWGEDPERRGQITLKSDNDAIWVTTDFDWFDDTGFDIHGPVANTAQDRQQFLAYDWEQRVTAEMIPESFNRTAYYLLPDWAAYWREVRLWLKAMGDDLFGPNAQPVHLEVLDIVGWVAYASGRTIYISFASANTILHELAHIVAGTLRGHDERFTATIIDIWERYIPDFDAARARTLAEQYGVKISQPAPIQPVSSLTRTVRDLLAKPAPPSPSDNEPIPPGQLLYSIRLQVGRTYDGYPQTEIPLSSRVPLCKVQERYADDTTYTATHLPQASFTVNPGGIWNGLEIGSYGDDKGGEYGVYFSGTPVAPGRVRVEISTQCPGGSSQDPRLVGYSEIIVVAPEP